MRNTIKKILRKTLHNKKNNQTNERKENFLRKFENIDTLKRKKNCQNDLFGDRKRTFILNLKLQRSTENSLIRIFLGFYRHLGVYATIMPFVDKNNKIVCFT